MANSVMTVSYSANTYGGGCSPESVSVRRIRIAGEGFVEINVRGKGPDWPHVRGGRLALTTELAEAIAHTVLAVARNADVPSVELRIQA